MTTVDRPTRVAADLLDSATAEGARESRSMKQQLDHWTRLGRAVSMQDTAARRRVMAALAGDMPLSALNAPERLVVNAELDASIQQHAQTTSYGAALATEGVTTVALDESGFMIRHHPDGSTSPAA